MPKRPAPSSSNPLKRRKTTAGPGIHKQNKKSTAKESIPIPINDEDDVTLSDQDYTFLEEYGDAVSFLRHLDRKDIAKSKHETKKNHRLEKSSIRTSRDDDELPSIDSDSDDSVSEPPSNRRVKKTRIDVDVELAYERASRARPSFERSSEHGVIERLPIKLADGQLVKSGVRDLENSRDMTEEEVEQSEDNEDESAVKVEDVSTGARFGRPAVLDVVGQGARKHRIEGAKEQIASICQEIVADPENNLGLLKRLYTFSQKEISSPKHPKPVANDPLIRKLAILSQLAVFRDIIPGYRIRELTEKEASEKVGQMVAHLREWEQGLVIAYQNYLRCLEAELKARSELTETALKCMCTLLTDVTHFNFRVNLMACVVSQLSRRSWTKISDMCIDTLNSVFRADTTGEPSLEIVRILNRMIKERHYRVHPNVLACLLNLRLKSELNVRASETKSYDANSTHPLSHSRAAKRRAKDKTTDQPRLSKKARKVLKERKEIEKEVREATAVVDKEKKTATQTETLKLLFTLYFRILKGPVTTPLLPAALYGIAKFAHLVNVDFFKDLMAVLKHIVSPDGETADERNTIDRLHVRLLSIVTAFELLSGQGEALNVDLDEFITHLYGLILPLSLIPIDLPPFSSDRHRSHRGLNIADLLFEALASVFSPRTSRATAPPWRSAAFSKRLLTASLNWPPDPAVRALKFVGGLISREPKLEALLSTEDQISDGVYRPDIDDPQLSHPFGTCFWELQVLENHWDSKIREEVYKLTRLAQP